MGVANVKLTNSVEQLQTFERHILSDIHAMDKMLKEGWFEIDKIRIGAEQEFCLVDKYSKPIGKSIEMMEHLDEKFFTTELARFNMEINATPREFKNTCLSDLENEISKNYNIATAVAEKMGIHTILSGIVPTIRKSDFTMDNLTPFDRYKALCDAINMIRGEHFQLKIEGNGPVSNPAKIRQDENWRVDMPFWGLGGEPNRRGNTVFLVLTAYKLQTTSYRLTG